jgi:hypothetical protein
MFAGSGGRIGTPTSSPRSVSAVGCNINARNKNGLFSNHRTFSTVAILGSLIMTVLTFGTMMRQYFQTAMLPP